MKEHNGEKMKAIQNRWNKFQIMEKISSKKFSYKYTLNV